LLPAEFLLIVDLSVGGSDSQQPFGIAVCDLLAGVGRQGGAFESGDGFARGFS
jgi:hypothetical protein